MKLKVDINNIINEQEAPYSGDEIEIARREIGPVTPDTDFDLIKKREGMEDLLSDFKASGESRGKLHLSLEFLDDVTYRKLSKAAREGNISKFQAIVRNSEKNLFKKKKQLIGVLAGTDAATVPLGIKWYKDIAIGFLAGYAQMDAEAALQAFVDSDMSSVLMDLYQLFRVKQPQSKLEAIKIIEKEDPTLLLPAKYNDPGRPGFFKLFGSYDEYFEDKVGTWSDPLYDAITAAFSAIEEILKIYSYPSLATSSLRTGPVKVALEGFDQFLNDVKIHVSDPKLRTLPPGAKRKRREVFGALLKTKDLYDAAKDAISYLKIVDKYKDDPRMIAGAYDSYEKSGDPISINERIRILLKFLKKLKSYRGRSGEGMKHLISRNIDGLDLGVMEKINVYFKLRNAQKMVEGKTQNKVFEMKKIKISLKDVAKESIITEGVFKFLDDLLSTPPPPRIDLAAAGGKSATVAGKRVLRSNQASRSVLDPDRIRKADSFIRTATDGAENLESVTRRGAAEAAASGEPVIIKIEATSELINPSTGQPFKFENYILVAEDGLVAVGSKNDLGKMQNLKGRLRRPKPPEPEAPARPEGGPTAPVTRGLSRIEADLAEMLRISQRGEEFYMGSIKNPFPDIKTYEYYIKGGAFKISEKLPGFLGGGKTIPRSWSKQYRQYLADPARRESNTFSELNMWHAIQPTGREGDFVYIGTRSADGTTRISGALGYQNGILTTTTNIKQVKTTKKTAAGDETTLGQESIPADAFKENPRGLASDLRDATNRAVLGVDMSGEIYTAYQGIKNIGVPARTWKVMKEVYFDANTKHPKFRGLLNILDLAGTSFGTRIGEPFFIALLKESGYLRTQTIISFARAWRFFKASATAAYVMLQTIALVREFYGKMSDEARGVERKKEAFLADPGNSNLRVDYEKAVRGHAKAIAKWLKDNGYPDASANLTDKVEELSKISDPDEQIVQLGYITDMAVTYLGTSEDEYAQLAAEIENNGFVKSLKDPYKMTLGQIDIAINDYLNKSLVDVGIGRAKKGVRGLDPDSLPTPDELRQKRDEAIKYLEEKAKEAQRAAELAAEAAKRKAEELAKKAAEKLEAEKAEQESRKAEEERAKQVQRDLDDMYRESKTLGPVLENYLGVDIIKNIKIKPSSKARSGDKK